MEYDKKIYIFTSGCVLAKSITVNVKVEVTSMYETLSEIDHENKEYDHQIENLIVDLDEEHASELLEKEAQLNYDFSGGEENEVAIKIFSG